MAGGNISLCGGGKSPYWCGDLKKSMERCCASQGRGLNLPGRPVYRPPTAGRGMYQCKKKVKRKLKK